MPTSAVQQEEGPIPGPVFPLYRRRVAPEKPIARLAIVPGYGDHSGRYADFMQWMAERGVECHAVDLRGHGLAAGRRGFVNRWTEYLDDLHAFLKSLAPSPLSPLPSPLFLLGHSHGGLVAAAAAQQGLSRVAGCILASPFFRGTVPVSPGKKRLAVWANCVLPWVLVSSGLRKEWMSSDPEMLQQSGKDPLVFHLATPRWYLEVLRVQQEVMGRASDVELPLLCLVGEKDPITDPASVREFSEAAGSSDKTIKVYPGQLHELLREAAREETYEEILGWIKGRI
jgi:lysophospholipase